MSKEVGTYEEEVLKFHRFVYYWNNFGIVLDE